MVNGIDNATDLTDVIAEPNSAGLSDFAFDAARSKSKQAAAGDSQASTKADALNQSSPWHTVDAGAHNVAQDKRQSQPDAHHLRIKKVTGYYSVGRQLLGSGASNSELTDMMDALAFVNDARTSDILNPGELVNLPTRETNGDLSFTDRVQGWKRTVKPDGTLRCEHTNGVGFEEKDGKGHHWGPNKKDTYTFTRHQGDVFKDFPDGSGESDWSGGEINTRYRDANGHDAWKNNTGSYGWFDERTNTNHKVSPNGDFSLSRGNLSETHHADGSVDIDDFDKGHRTFKDKLGNETQKWRDGTVLVNNVDHTGNSDRLYPNGDFSSQHWGLQPAENWVEHYDAKTGTTTRTDSQHNRTTLTRNHTMTVENANGSGYIKYQDGHEHHWTQGKKIFFDVYPDWSKAEKAGEHLKTLVRTHGKNADKVAEFDTDMSTFVSRAKTRGLSPADVESTFANISRLLATANSKTTSSEHMLLAQSLMAQAASPSDTDQGQHNSCTITAAAEVAMTYNPALTTNMAVSIALTGNWTASDGKTIHVDERSLRPGKEESAVSPFDGLPPDSNRSYATQVLNLAMANDILQRRNPQKFYRQRNPQFTGDTGERVLDQNWHTDMSDQQAWIQDAKGNSVQVRQTRPTNWPEVTTEEMNAAVKRYIGLDALIELPKIGDGKAPNLSSVKDLGNYLRMRKDQNRLPVIFSVSIPDSDGHYFSVTDIDLSADRAFISNQWGVSSDKWVGLQALYDQGSQKNPLHF